MINFIKYNVYHKLSQEKILVFYVQMVWASAMMEVFSFGANKFNNSI